MAEKNKTLTCTFFVGGMPVKELTPEQSEKLAKRVGEAMSTYYTAHPEEYKNINGAKNK